MEVKETCWVINYIMLNNKEKYKLLSPFQCNVVVLYISKSASMFSFYPISNSNLQNETEEVVLNYASSYFQTKRKMQILKGDNIYNANKCTVL